MSGKPWTGRVCVPLSAEQDAALNLGSTDWLKHFETVEIPADAFQALDGAGFWDDVNSRCGSLIDQYEEEWIELGGLEKLIACLSDWRSNRKNLPLEVQSIVSNLETLALKARERGVPVIFVF